MTDIHFYHNHPKPVAAACQLVSRACQRGRKVVLVAAGPALARELDLALWTFDQQSFVPHVPIDSPLAAETPVVIAASGQRSDWPHHDMLINVGGPIPEGYQDFAMVLEIVGRGDDERQSARERWMSYRAQGCTPVPHDMEQGK